MPPVLRLIVPVILFSCLSLISSKPNFVVLFICFSMSSTLSDSPLEIEEAVKIPTTRSTSNQKRNNRLKSASSDFPVSGYDALSRGDKILVYVAFITNGVATLLAWNSVVNSYVALQNFIWPKSNFFYMLGAFEYAAVALTSIAVYPINNLNVSLVYISGVMNVLVSLLFPTVTYFYAGNENVTIGKWLLVGISLLAGIGSGLFQVVGFAFASIMPFPNIFPLISGGQGMSGVLTFLSYLFLSLIVFPKTLYGQQMLLYTFFAVGICIIVVHLIAFTLLNRRSWFKQIVQQAILSSDEAANFRSMKTSKTDNHDPVNNHDNLIIMTDQTQCKNHDHDLTLDHEQTQCKDLPENCKDYLSAAKTRGATDITDNHKICSSSSVEDDCDRSTPPPRHILSICYDCGVYVLAGSLTIIITMLVYPSTGPYNWPANYTIKTITAGTFQVTNMCMRYAPTWEIFRIRRQWLLPLVISRFLFVPLFLTPARFARENDFATHPTTLIILMLAFAIIHGWTLTLASMYATSSLENPKEKAIASKILVICYASSTVIGLFLSWLFLL